MQWYNRSVYRLIAVLFGLFLLSACSTTGNTFNAAGINSITVGETTLDEASIYLKSQPEDVWRQGSTTLARWAFQGTIATDAVYLRQELWLRFGADGTFERIEKTINIPGIYQPKPRPKNDGWVAPSQHTDLNDWVPASSNTSLDDW